jgi:hypothetical protein
VFHLRSPSAFPLMLHWCEPGVIWLAICLSSAVPLQVFNRGFGPMFPVRVLVGVVRELLKLSTHDSLFVDSPLSSLGVRQVIPHCFCQSHALHSSGVGTHPRPLTRPTLAPPSNPVQARALQAHIENTALSGGGGQAERALATLRGFGGSAVLVSSNLRRALATAVIGLWGRLSQGDRLLVLSELQEISRNPDTLALAPPGGVPDLDSLFSQLGPQFHYGVLDGSTHKGSKPLGGNGLTRLNAFANWVFTRSEDTVVATGHSLYFKHFFNTFLPANATVRLAAPSLSLPSPSACSGTPAVAPTHAALTPRGGMQGVAAAARSKKLSNCGMVTFTLECSRVGSRTVHRIDPASVCVLYGKIG